MERQVGKWRDGRMERGLVNWVNGWRKGSREGEGKDGSMDERIIERV